MNQLKPAEGELDRLTAEFTERTAGVERAVVISSAGLALASDRTLSRDGVDRLAAAVSGLASLAGAAARIFEGGRPGQTVVEMERGFLFLAPMDRGATLAVTTGRGADLGLVGYELAVLADRISAPLVESLKAKARERI
ncbi:roadblock/LC7 domain-containing protein [Kitasatospora sp. NPDC101176]|uniref:roadblock/LC7 domain-containing protein n=1 Tax=Kitasatospora sp. NPDC101176 TaxID=3364099 RepID=UPI00380F3A38